MFNKYDEEIKSLEQCIEKKYVELDELNSDVHFARVRICDVHEEIESLETRIEDLKNNRIFRIARIKKRLSIGLCASLWIAFAALLSAKAIASQTEEDLSCPSAVSSYFDGFQAGTREVKVQMQSAFNQGYSAGYNHKFSL